MKRTAGKPAAALLAACLLCAGGALPAGAVDELQGTAENGYTATVENGNNWYTVYGNNGNAVEGVVTGYVVMTGGEAGTVYGGYANTDVTVQDSTVTLSGGKVIFSGGTGTAYVYGGSSAYGDAVGNRVTIEEGGEVNGNVIGGFGRGLVADNMVEITGGTVQGIVYGGFDSSSMADSVVSGNRVILSGGTVIGYVNGGYCGSSNVSSTVKNNTVTLSGDVDVAGAYLYGGDAVNPSGMITGNTLVVDNWKSRNEKGNVVGGLHNFDSIEFQNVRLSGNGETTSLTVADGGTVEKIGGVKITSLAAGDYAAGTNLKATVKWDSRLGTDVTIADNLQKNTEGWFTTDRAASGLYATRYSGINVTQDSTNKNQVNIFAEVTASAVTGKFIDEDGTAHYNSRYETETDTPQPLVIDKDFSLDNIKTVAGVYDVSTVGNVKGASGGQVRVTGNVTFDGVVYGGYSQNGSAAGNTVMLQNADASALDVYGGKSESNGTTISDNTLVVDGTSTVKGLHNFSSVNFQNVALSEVKDGGSGTEISLGVSIGGTVDGMENAAVTLTNIKTPQAGDLASGTKYAATVSWADGIGANLSDAEKVQIEDGVLGTAYKTANRGSSGLYVNRFDTSAMTETNSVTLTSTVDASALTGKFIDENGKAHYNSAYTPDENGTGQTLVIGDGFTTNVDTVAGAYAAGNQTASGGQLRIEGDYDGTVYAGYSESGAVTDNHVYLNGTKADSLHLLGQNDTSTSDGGNTLHVTGTGNTVGSVADFDAISFEDITWQNGGTILSIEKEDEAGRLTDTAVSVNGLSLAGGKPLSAGQSMTLLESKQDMGLGDAKKIPLNDAEDFTAGVATVGKGTMAISEDGKQLTYRIDGVGLNSQTTVIAENRTAAAAFLNQGADIAADSLDLLGSDYKYGLRTFGAVYGNRSTYDAAGDMKINGWSEIVGLGNVHRKGAGDLSWGIFYENGTGNYRTWNEFNNEMFRGDGSLLYNGGGAALRYKRDDGWYYEASVRAGTLSASMENAVKNGNGNSYGFDSDSTYWGVHAGFGKVIETSRGEWNVYGKYFHTDIDGDSFTIADDRFAFDSLTSDRLRLGARYMADTDKAWSLYYGAAYEYEFSGDSCMKAGQFEAPEQSLQGSTVFGEIGTVWGRKDSPWSMDVNLRGYAGEREGFSGMVQLAYAF